MAGNPASRFIATREEDADTHPPCSLRESGQLEKHADVVLMLYRDGYYDNGNGGVDNDRANVMEVWARKNRLDLPASRGQAGGPSGERCELFWRGEVMRCYEMAMKEVEGWDEEMRIELS